MSGASLNLPTFSELGSLATAWLATYLVHSTVLLALAWLATRALASPRTREVLWRAALLGGLCTASVQVFAGLRPALGRYEVGAIAAVEAATSTEGLQVDASALLAALEAGPLAAQDVPRPAAETRGWLDSNLAGRDLAHVGPAALSVGGLVAVASLMCGVAVLTRRRRSQSRLVAGPLAQLFAELVADDRRLRGTELWVCRKSDTPYASGIWSPRVVVPARVAAELSRDEQRAMLAHELAHVERRDPLWLGLTRALQLCLPLQPLNALARRRLNDCAELLCDARAVERTGDRLALAQSLAKVAGWLVKDDVLPDAACAMASRRSLLGVRVARILEEDGEPRTREVPVLRAAAALALAGTALAAPVVHVRVAGSQPEAWIGSAAIDHAAPALSAVAPHADTLQSAAPSALDSRVRSELAQLAEVLDLAVHELEAELTALRAASDGRALDSALAARVAQLEQRAGDVRARAKRIRALLSGAATGGVEAPPPGRRRAAATAPTPSAR